MFKQTLHPLANHCPGPVGQKSTLEYLKTPGSLHHLLSPVWDKYECSHLQWLALFFSSSSARFCVTQDSWYFAVITPFLLTGLLMSPLPQSLSHAHVIPYLRERRLTHFQKVLL